jgi:hypothetical protein
MTPDCPDSSDKATAPLSEVLARIGWELRDLASAADDLQAVISPNVSNCRCTQWSDLTALQSLDLMRQTLEGVAHFVEALAIAGGGNLQNDPHVDPHHASRGVMLSALSTRLTRSRGVDAATASTASGDCEHF